MNKCLLTLLLAVTSCAGNVITEAEYKELVEQSYRSVPDSLLTEEHKRIRDLELDICGTRVSVEDNKLVLTIDRSYYQAHSIPEFYYDLLLYELEQNNRFIEQWNKEHDAANQISADKLLDDYRAKIKTGVAAYLR